MKQKIFADDLGKKQLMPIDVLIDALRKAGIVLEEVEDDSGELYIWTRRNRDVVYIGKANSAKRFSEERKWVEELRNLDITTNVSAFPIIIQRHNAKQRRFKINSVSYDDFVKRLRGQGWKWGDKPLSMSKYPVTEWKKSSDFIEKVLVRTVLHFGFFAANSQYGGIWDSQIDTPADPLAHFIAIDYGAYVETPSDSD